MKALMSLGAVLGFLIGSSSAVSGQAPWTTALWRGSVGALLVALLARWWSRVWLRGLQDALLEKRKARVAQNQAKTAKP